MIEVVVMKNGINCMNIFNSPGFRCTSLVSVVMCMKTM